MVRAGRPGLAVFLLAAGFPAAAQVAPPQPAAQPAGTPAPVPAAPAAAPRVTEVEALNRANTELVLTLLRTTLVALGQANQTGNYTVLRDLSAPDFAAKNSATDLANIFATLRAHRINLDAVVLLDPQISRATITPEKKLYLTGSLTTKPFPITFELLFSPLDGSWRLDGLSITPVENLAATSSPTALQPTVASAATHHKPAPRARAAKTRIAPPPAAPPSGQVVPATLN